MPKAFSFCFCFVAFLDFGFWFVFFFFLSLCFIRLWVQFILFSKNKKKKWKSAIISKYYFLILSRHSSIFLHILLIVSLPIYFPKDNKVIHKFNFAAVSSFSKSQQKSGARWELCGLRFQKITKKLHSKKRFISAVF